MTAPTGLGRTLAVLASIVAIVTVGVSIYLDPPQVIRKHRLDQIRASSLSNLQRRIGNFGRDEKRLPASLTELMNGSTDSEKTLHDPESGLDYEYRVVSVDRYELCATFDQASGSAWDENSDWAHGAGRTCFERRDAGIAAPAK